MVALAVHRIPNPIRSDPPQCFWPPLRGLHFHLRDLILPPNPTAGVCHPTDCVGGADEGEGFGWRRDGGCGGAAEESRRGGFGSGAKPHRSLQFLSLPLPRSSRPSLSPLPRQQRRLSCLVIKRRAMGHLPVQHAFHGVRSVITTSSSA